MSASSMSEVSFGFNASIARHAIRYRHEAEKIPGKTLARRE